MICIAASNLRRGELPWTLRNLTGDGYVLCLDSNMVT